MKTLLILLLILLVMFASPILGIVLIVLWLLLSRHSSRWLIAQW